MKKTDIKKFYGEIAGDKYLKEIRRFGLRYDEMVETIVNILTLEAPKEILDIGSGVGNVEELILEKLPDSKITCVELSPEMVEVSKKRLREFNKDKLEIICDDIFNFKPNKKFDAIFSNLMIHNVPFDRKLVLLKRVKNWLKPKGVFIWGEFIDWEDKKVAEYYMDYRKKVILESGAKKEFVEEILAKESKDPRLTVTETIDLLRKAEFDKPEVLWVYSFLAVFRVRNYKK